MNIARWLYPLKNPTFYKLRILIGANRLRAQAQAWEVCFVVTLVQHDDARQFVGEVCLHD
jgi:hypothetical protein